MLALLSAVYLWAVGWMTLTVRPYGGDISSAVDRLIAWFALRPSTAWITYERVEFGANIAMFVPLGVLVVLWFGVRGWWAAPLVGLATSGVIEGSQLLFLPSRFPTVSDLVANTLGATAGMLLMLLLVFLLAPSPVRASRSS